MAGQGSRSRALPVGDSPQDGPNRRIGLVLAVHALSFAVLACVVFRVNEAALFLRWDGTRILTGAWNQAHWPGPFLAMGLDFLKANGELAMPILYNLDPGFLLSRLIAGDDTIRWLVYAVQALLFFLATVYVLLRMGFGAAWALFAAWGACLLALPFFVPTLTFIRLWGNPIFLTAFAAAFAAVGLYRGAGTGTRAGDVARTFAIAILLGYVAAVQAPTFVMIAPTVGVLLFAAFALADGWPERLRKFAVGLGVLLLMVPVLSYVLELHAYAKTTFFWREMVSLPVTWRSVSFLVYIHGESSPLGVAIFLTAPFGALYAVWKGGLRLRVAAGGYLGFVVLLVAATAALRLLGQRWGGPPPAYADLPMLPFHVLFSGIAVAAAVGAIVNRGLLGRMADRIRATVARHGARVSAPACALAAILPWIAYPVALARHDTAAFQAHGPWPWPPAKTEAVAFLADRIGLSDGAPFRGRVANLAASEGGNPTPFMNQHAYDQVAIRATGNDLRNNGLWYYDIPTLMTSTHYSSPFFHAVATRLLNEPDTIMDRPHTTATVFDGRILRALGVRYVIHDREILGDATLVARFPMPDRQYLIYDLDGANVGSYTPVRALVVPDTRAALETLARDDFDPRETVLVHEPVDTDLVPLLEAELSVEREGLRLKARSDGISIVLLPVEFSRCLAFDLKTAGALPPRTFRANVNQTAVLFDRSVEGTIRLVFGAFANRGCRYADLGDARRLGLGGLQGWWPK